MVLRLKPSAASLEIEAMRELLGEMVKLNDEFNKELDKNTNRDRINAKKIESLMDSVPRLATIAELALKRIEMLESALSNLQDRIRVIEKEKNTVHRIRTTNTTQAPFAEGSLAPTKNLWDDLDE